MKVEPIRSVRDIRSIKKLLAASPREFAIFCTGINSNLRASDILQLTVGHARTLKAGGEIVVVEKKTKKERRITANEEMASALRLLVDHRLETEGALSDADPLFVGQRGPIRVPTVSRLVKEWCAAVNLTGNYSSHTMRKTFGYHCRVRMNMSVAQLMYIYNHSNQKMTLEYLCIQPDEVRDAYMKLVY
jgi:integrase